MHLVKYRLRCLGLKAALFLQLTVTKGSIMSMDKDKPVLVTPNFLILLLTKNKFLATYLAFIMDDVDYAEKKLGEGVLLL